MDDCDIENIREIKGLDQLTNLKILELNRNKITEIVGFEKLVNLEELSLNSNHILKIKGFLVILEGA